MTRYIGLRLLGAIPTVFLVFTLVFLAMRLLPGDPTTAILGENASVEQLAALRERLGLNKSLWQQYLDYLYQIAHFDLGRSMSNRVPIITLLAEHLPYTLELTVAALIIGSAIGIPIGVISALKRNTSIDYFSRVFALSGLSVPDFFLGLMLLILFSLILGWFPLMGGGEEFGERMYHLVLPAITLGLVKSAFIMRMTRSAMLDVLRRDYVRMARSKGVPWRTVVFKHALRNALVPVVTAIGISTIATLAGTISIELVFSRPGIGQLLVGAISSRDYTLIQASLSFFALLVVVVNLITDIVYSLIDPRITL